MLKGQKYLAVSVNSYYLCINKNKLITTKTKQNENN